MNLYFEITADLLKQTADLEQEIIKNEILPVISEKIEPLITQIQREFVFVFDYVPNEPLIVQFISNTLDNAYSSSQKDIAKGWYFMNLSSTATKKQQIEKISEEYKFNIKVEIV